MREGAVSMSMLTSCRESCLAVFGGARRRPDIRLHNCTYYIHRPYWPIYKFFYMMADKFTEVGIGRDFSLDRNIYSFQSWMLFVNKQAN